MEDLLYVGTVIYEGSMVIVTDLTNNDVEAKRMSMDMSFLQCMPSPGCDEIWCTAVATSAGNRR